MDSSDLNIALQNFRKRYRVSFKFGHCVQTELVLLLRSHGEAALFCHLRKICLQNGHSASTSNSLFSGIINLLL
jgi:hypothetical protein